MPGEPLTVALRLAAIPGWHTYWRNPGDSGEPTRIEWRLPAGFAAGEIEWPVPSRIPVGPLMNFGYKGEVLLLIRVVVPKNLDQKTFTLRAKANWLVCEVQCLQQEGEFALTLPEAGSAAADRAWEKPIAAARAALPVPASPEWSFKAKAEESAASLAITAPFALKEAFFLPFEEGKIEPAAPQALAREGDGYRLALRAAAQPVGPFDRVHGFCFSGKTTGGRCPHHRALRRPGAGRGARFAFAGGLILNLMPCVLPVLSIKVLGLRAGARAAAGCAGSTRGRARVVLAAGRAARGLRALGAADRLGIPAAVAGLRRVARAFPRCWRSTCPACSSSGFALAGGTCGHFLTGVLAVVVASPLHRAVHGRGARLCAVESGWRAFAVFTALGLGMALPYAALAWRPDWLRWLPKPGPGWRA